MAASLFASEYELFPDRRRWTVQECADLAVAGRLIGRYEVLDGAVVDKTGQNPAHATVIKRLMRVMAALFGLDLIWVQSPITLVSPDNIYTEPEPDVAITREPESAYLGRHPGPKDLFMVIEVSDTSLRTDLIVKARMYARSEIPEYWIVNLPARQVHIHTEPVDGDYQQVTVHRENETVSLRTHPEVQISVSDLLPPVEI